MKISLDTFNQFLKNLDPHVAIIGRGAAFFGVGIVAGIILKKYLRLMFLSLIICFFVIKGLEYQHILNIDWGTLNLLLGLRPSISINEVALSIYHWGANNPAESVPGGVGFFLGFNIA